MTFPISSPPCPELRSLLEGAHPGAEAVSGWTALRDAALDEATKAGTLTGARRQAIGDLELRAQQITARPGESAEGTQARRQCAKECAAILARAAGQSTPLLGALPARILHPLLIREQVLRLRFNLMPVARQHDAAALGELVLEVWYAYVAVFTAADERTWSRAQDVAEELLDRFERLARPSGNP